MRGWGGVWNDSGRRYFVGVYRFFVFEKYIVIDLKGLGCNEMYLICLVEINLVLGDLRDILKLVWVWRILNLGCWIVFLNFGCLGVGYFEFLRIYLFSLGRSRLRNMRFFRCFVCNVGEFLFVYGYVRVFCVLNVVMSYWDEFVVIRLRFFMKINFFFGVEFFINE